MSWQDFALCRGRDDIGWVPRYGALHSGRNLAAAKAVCAKCPVREACLDEALRGHWFGIWGGTSDRERRRMRRAQGPEMAVQKVDSA